MADTENADEKSWSDIAMDVAEWVLISAILPVAVPAAIVFLIFFLKSDGKPLNDFLRQGDLVLAATVLSAAVIYDLTEALASNKVAKKHIFFPRLILSAIACLAGIYYIFLRTLMNQVQETAINPKAVFVGPTFFALAVLISIYARFRLRLGRKSNG